MKKLTDNEIGELLKKQPPKWSDEEKKELKRLIDKGLKSSSIYKAKVFPDKPLNSIANRIQVLKGNR